MKRIGVMCIHTGATRTPGGCEIYRANMPLEYLGRQPRWDTSWTYFDDVLKRYEAHGLSGWDDIIGAHDIFVFPRLALSHDPRSSLAIASFFALIRMTGKRIVYEADDDYTNQYRQVIDGDAITPASWADAITVTTPYLADTMKQATHRPVHVLPNCIDGEVWKSHNSIQRRDWLAGKIVIGLTGSPTHYWDWMVLKDILKPLLEGNPNAHLIVMGFHPDYLNGLPQTSYLDALDYMRYSQIVRDCDIILAPVNPHDKFNLGKSPLKAIEGQAAERKLDSSYRAGAAVIATDNLIYQLVINNNRTGLLVKHTPQAWYEALQRLLTDDLLRRNLQIEGYKSAWRNFDIAQQWPRWARTYRKILDLPSNPYPLPI